MVEHPETFAQRYVSSGYFALFLAFENRSRKKKINIIGAFTCLFLFFMPVFKILDRYIIRQYLSAFIFAIVVFAAIAIIIDVSERLDDFTEKNAPMHLIFGQYYLNFIPWIVLLLSPLFIFVAVIFFTSRLAARSEIIAMLGSGVGFYRTLLVPYLFSAFLLAIGQLYANHYLVPQSNVRRLDFEATYIKNRTVKSESNIHLQIAPGVYVYIEQYTQRDSTGSRFTLEETSAQNKYIAKISAKRLKWIGSAESPLWRLEDVTYRHFDGLTETLTKTQKLDTALQFFPTDFSLQINEKDALTSPELGKLIARERQKGMPTETYKVEYHRRTAIPFATFILTTMGFALASRKVRGGMGLHLALGIGLSSLYVLLLQFSTTFATNGNLAPLLAVWVPNIVFGILAVYLVLKAPK